MIAILSGLVAGAGHVWSGPDHLSAIAPLAANRPTRSWVPGLRWGIGHSAGVILVGVISLWLRDLIPVPWLSLWGERMVGVLLVGIGLWGLHKVLKRNVHVHEHEHDGERHVHLHIHPERNTRAPLQMHSHGHAAFGIGILHGLAGSSHLLGILPMLAFPDRAQAAAYLAAFAAGTVASMAGFSWLVGATASRCALKGHRFHQGLSACCSVAALLVGGFWLVQTFGSGIPG